MERHKADVAKTKLFTSRLDICKMCQNFFLLKKPLINIIRFLNNPCSLNHTNHSRADSERLNETFDDFCNSRYVDVERRKSRRPNSSPEQMNVVKERIQMVPLKP